MKIHINNILPEAEFSIWNLCMSLYYFFINFMH